MDYEDLVDQFIVNDHNDPEICSQENEQSHGEESSPDFTSELMKIHLKTVILARHLSLRTAHLDRVKERNRVFEARRKELLAGSPRGGEVNVQSGERRRRILKGGLGTSTDNSTNSSVLSDPSAASDELVPCRLELDYDGYKLSDVFLLQPSTDSDTLGLLSTQLCQDYDLPADPFQGAIVRCLKDQVEEWQVYQGALEGMKDSLPFGEIGPVPVRLDIIVGLHRLEDQLEVDLDPEISTSAAMRQFVAALRSPDKRILPEPEYSPFRPLILHNLLEQLMLWRKAIVFGGYHRDPRSNNLKFHDGDVAVLLNDPATAPSSSVRRHFAHTNTFTPLLSTLTLEELDKIEAGRERESRRRKRTGLTVATASATSAAAAVAAAVSTSGTLTAKRAAASVAIVNNLTGTVRSPPRTLPTPTSYRGGLHRIQSNSHNSDEEGPASGPRKRGRKSKY